MMSSPHEYRELMKAQFHFGETRTVDEVFAEQKRRHEERAQASRRERSGKGRTFANTGAPPVQGQPAQSEIDKVKALLGRTE